MAARFTVDLEYFYHALYPSTQWRFYDEHQSVQTLYHLLEILEEHRVKATFYVLGVIAKGDRSVIRSIASHGHAFGSHGWSHQSFEREGDEYDQETRKYLPACTGYRAPYWNGQRRPGYAGGVFFRLLPYPLLKMELLRSKELYVHLHDLDLHPGMLRRSIAIGDPWHKLERLLREVSFV